MVVSVQIAPPDFDPVFAALADHTRRDIVRRAINAEEGVLELASHYPMSFAADFNEWVESIGKLGGDPPKLGRGGGPPTSPATFPKPDLPPGGRVESYMTGPAGDQPHGYWDVLEVEPPRRILFRAGFANADGTPNTEMPINTIRVGIEEVAQGRTRMSLGIVFPSTEAMEQVLAMGTEEGLSQAVSQIDAILAEETIQR